MPWPALTLQIRRRGALIFFLASALLLLFGLLVHPLGDPDVFIHLRDGRFWLESGLHVDREPFAYTVPDKPFEKAEWLFRIGLYLLFRAGGLNLLILVKALLMTLAVFCLGRLMLRRWPQPGVVVALLALAVLAPMTRVFPERPYVLTYLFLPISLLWLDDYRRAGGSDPRADWGLWKLPALTLVWANFHPGFMTLFGFLGAQWAEDALQAWRARDRGAGRRARALLLTGAAVFLAGAVNPQGFGLYPYILNIMGSHDYMNFITEWMPPRFSEEPFFFALLILAWAAQLGNVSRLRLRDALPLLAFSYMGVNSYRNIPVFLIAALPGLTANLADLWARFRPAGPAPDPARPAGRAWWLGGGLCLLALLGAAASGLAFRLGEIPRFYPQGALAWLERHPLQGRLLTHDIWGGYTGWATHGRVKIFMDGRLPTFGEKLYADYRKMIWGDPATCYTLLDRYVIQGVLVSPKNDLRLFQALWASHQWTLVYWDDVSLLYVRNPGLNQQLIRDFAFFAVDPRHTPYFNPDLQAQALEEIRRAQTQAPDSFLPYFFEGDLALRQGALAASRGALERARALAPAPPPHPAEPGHFGQAGKPHRRSRTTLAAGAAPGHRGAFAGHGRLPIGAAALRGGRCRPPPGSGAMAGKSPALDAGVGTGPGVETAPGLRKIKQRSRPSFRLLRCCVV
jgi:hypothetical protein